MGLEPTTTEITTRGSTNWATTAITIAKKGKIDRLNGAPGRIRTCGHLLRREMLYPAELQALLEDFYILKQVLNISKTKPLYIKKSL